MYRKAGVCMGGARRGRRGGAGHRREFASAARSGMAPATSGRGPAKAKRQIKIA